MPTQPQPEGRDRVPAGPPQPEERFQPNHPLPPRRGPNPVWLVLAVLLLAGLVFFVAKRRNRSGTNGPGAARPMANFPVPVVSGVVEQKQVPIFLDGLGTVQAFNTVTVHSRVDGQVVKVAFTEGQDVKAGDLLAKIDPAPFKAQLDQNLAKKAQDEAQLAIARLTLERDKELLNGKIISQQDYDTQKATVDQLEALVRGDQALIDNAQIQLDYTSITSPLDGRTGIRMIDQGNIVHATDSNGLVVITQLRPVSLSFTLPEQNLPQLREHLPPDGALPIVAMDRDNRSTLSQGKLAVIDNQIDVTTGTIRLKATFANDDLKLWPGQFVNVRVLLETRQGSVVPASVVQHGPDGDFAFVITPDLTAQVRKIKVFQVDRGQALIQEGLNPGERVVVDGQYKLQAGSKVKLPEDKPKSEHGPARPSSAAPKANPS